MKLASTLTTLPLVIAVATVLITPDPTYDVNGVVRPHKTLTAPIVAIVSASLYRELSSDKAKGGLAPELSTPDLLPLLWTCRC